MTAHIQLTERTERLIALIDSADARARVTALFETETALHGPPTVEVLERVRFAVIKLALRGPEMLQVAAELFRVDVRDLLVAADFANDLQAHDKWCAAMLADRD